MRRMSSCSALRHRLGRQEAAGWPIFALWKKPKKRASPQDRQASACSHTQKKRRALVFLAPQNRLDIYQVLEAVHAQPPARHVAIKSIQEPRRWSSASYWSAQATGSTTRRTCSTTESEKPRLRHQADELPVPRAGCSNQGLKSTREPATRLASSAPANVTSQSGSRHGLSARTWLYPGTTRTLLAPMSRSSAEGQPTSSKLTLQVYKISASTTSS